MKDENRKEPECAARPDLVSLGRILIARTLLALLAISAGVAHGDELGATLKQRVSAVLEGQRPLADVTLEVTGGRPERNSLTVYGSGVGIWNREKQFSLTPGEHKELLNRLLTSGLFEMPEHPRPPREQEPALNPPVIVRSVSVRVGDLERVVSQNNKVWTLMSLETLVTDLFKLCEKPASRGTGASSLTDGLEKIAKGKLAPETLLVVLNLPPVAGRGPAKGENGITATLDGGTLTWAEQAPGEAAVVSRGPAPAERVRSLAALLAETGFEKFPVNLYRERYVDLRSMVLGRVQSIQARKFVGLSPAKFSAQQKGLERIIEAILGLAPPARGVPSDAPGDRKPAGAAP